MKNRHVTLLLYKHSHSPANASRWILCCRVYMKMYLGNVKPNQIYAVNDNNIYQTCTSLQISKQIWSPNHYVIFRGRKGNANQARESGKLMAFVVMSISVLETITYVILFETCFEAICLLFVLEWVLFKASFSCMV